MCLEGRQDMDYERVWQKECYESSVAYVNYDAEPLTKELFIGDYNSGRILFAVQAITGDEI